MTSVFGQLIKNVFTSWMGMVVTIVVTFFFTPYLIGQLGKSQYGIWSFVFSLVAYMRLADVGMNQAVARYIPKYFAVDDWNQLNQVISSAARIYTYISVAIVIASAVIAYGLLQFFQISPEYLKAARITLLLLGVNQAVSYFFIPFAALLPFHRADIVNYFEAAQLVVQTLLIVLCLELGYGLAAMGLTVLLLNIVTLLIRYAIRRKLFPKVAFSTGAITSDKTRELLSYGLTSLLIVAAWILIYQNQNIVIGRFLSMEDIAVFAVPAAVITQLRNSINAVAVPIVPTISHIDALEDQRQIMDVYLKASRYLYYFSTFVSVMLIVYGGPFILLWVGEDFRQAITILYLLAVPACLYLPQMVANSVLFGVSKHRILLYVLGAEGLSNLVLSLLLVRPYGLLGVALGTAIPQILIYSVIYPVVFHRAMQGSVKHYYVTSLRSMIWALGLTLPVAILLRTLVGPDAWSRFVLDCFIASALVGIGFVALILEPDDRQKVLSKLRLGPTRAAAVPTGRRVADSTPPEQDKRRGQ